MQKGKPDWRLSGDYGASLLEGQGMRAGVRERDGGMQWGKGGGQWVRGDEDSGIWRGDEGRGGVQRLKAREAVD